ncbi:thiamine diphosphokinase [Pseudobutyrivibrio sp. MD2005]|uniref:thiamine diphosphokinase n=1 Tax=Pseudobutyrivibrio sp. MD2005 TaxID=1410616 RepID=UPI00048467BC|nr:thiamine diphosphokinase [Pseudobutyrivibrio sp. MD2005]
MITFIVGAMIKDIEFLKNVISESSEARFIIACDKGYEHVIAAGAKPDVIIGDFDSASQGEPEPACSGKIIKLNPIKDDTDIEAALRYAFDNTEGDITILGALGGRVDHSLGNIALLGMGLKEGRKVYLVDETNRLQMIGAGMKLVIKKDEQYGKYVSVFPYYGSAVVTMEGFKYPLKNAKLEGFNTLTVSNEIVDTNATISLECGYLLVCECGE